MARNEKKAESIYNLSNYLKEDKILPIYLFFGEDTFTITNAVKMVTKLIDNLIVSEFDKQVIDCTKETKIHQIIDEASAFPFGGSKKMVVVKNFELVNEKKTFIDYVNNPADFTVLVLTQYGKKIDLSREPYSSMYDKQYIFEAQELKGVELQQWIVREAKRLNMKISQENAAVLVDLIGENKALVEMNLLKFTNYIEKNAEITPETIDKLTSLTKEYNVFNLQDSIGIGNKAEALKIAYNLIDNGNEAIYIVTMLTKYINTVARSIELSSLNLNENQAAKQLGLSYYYYKNCAKAGYLKSLPRLYRASEALLEADKAIKTTSADDKSIVTILITQMLG
ncbi:MAG: DNA polymerase III subunit delta [Bacteroidetes bacterium]|nr:DNA polymerase III subunit delta [Bacteroidota bacterium]